jgi:hypothetical protein
MRALNITSGHQRPETIPSGTQPDRFTGCLEMEKRLASEDTNPVRFSREESVRITNPKNPGSLKYQLAEGIEPPTL